jgi:hypothetical protein
VASKLELLHGGSISNRLVPRHLVVLQRLSTVSVAR